MEINLSFDDNRHASLVFGHYDQNLAKLERRLGVIANVNGNLVTIKGSPEACEHARAGAGESLRARQNGAAGHAWRRRRRDSGRRPSRHVVSERKRRRAHRLRADRHAAARSGARPKRRPRPLSPHNETLRAGVRRRAGRHRQDLARRRLRRAFARAGRRRTAGPLASRRRGGRTARIPARRHARQGRSLSAADLRRARRFHGRPHAGARPCRPA